MCFGLQYFLIWVLFKASGAKISTDYFQLILPRTRLTSGIIKSEIGLSLQRCALTCAINNSRVAFNYDVVNQICEPIVKQENVSISSLSTNSNFNYYIVKSLSPCQNKPCLYGSECVVTSDRMDYRCLKCPYPMGGKNCDKLNCGTTCFRLNETVYFAYPNESLTSVQSYLKCTSLGMSMVMIKDNVTHQFIRSQFSTLYVNQTSKKEAYWLGLNRTSSSSSSPWKWTDGTPLGPFTAWANTGSSDLCVCLPNGAGFSFNWDPDPCNKYKGWLYFTFCQQTYSFLKTK